MYAFLLSTQWVMHLLSGHRRSVLHDDFFFPPANIYAKLAKANTTDTFTNSITTLNIVPGNSSGRSCHTIRAETIRALIRIMIRFRFMVYLPSDTRYGFAKSPSVPRGAGLRFIFRHCSVRLCTPHSSRFARLASGAFYCAA